MGLYLIIHLIGTIIGIIVHIHTASKEHDITLEELTLISLLCILFSWIFIAGFYLECYHDKVIFKKKENEKY